MELELNAETIDRLARSIARANLTAADEFIEEQTANWLPDNRRKVGEIGAPMDGDGQTLTAAQRLERWRHEKPAAERAIETAKTNAIEQSKQNELNRIRREADESARLEANQARYDADLAQHKAAAIIARQAGRPEPPAPDASKYLLDADALAMQRHREGMNGYS